MKNDTTKIRVCSICGLEAGKCLGHPGLMFGMHHTFNVPHGDGYSLRGNEPTKLVNRDQYIKETLERRRTYGSPKSDG